MTTIAVYGSTQEADLARLRLEAAGIPVHIPDAALASFLLYTPPLVSGIRLQVAENDAPTAREILDAPAPVPGSLEIDPD